MDVLKNGVKQGETYVNRGMEGAEVSYEVFLGSEEDRYAADEYHYSSAEEAVQRLAGVQRAVHAGNDRKPADSGVSGGEESVRKVPGP